ncbi:MAG: hypothetical protein GY884_21785 [Proteobacteria bacterium]|nr:hypothetical protein [Pseudomonadota bacterium]
MIWLLACAGPPVETLTLSGIEIEADVPVFDPRLDEVALGLTVTLTGDPLPGCAVEVGAMQERGWTSDLGSWDADWDAPARLAWDGTMEEGAVRQGVVQVVATLVCPDGTAVATAEIDVVRLAPVELSFDSGVDLAFHKTSLDVWEVTELADVPAWTRLPGEEPADPWADPDRPPWGAEGPGDEHNLPIAQIAGETMQVTATFEGSETSEHTILVGGPGDAWQTWSPEAVRIWTTDPAPTIVGHDELALTWSYAVLVDDQPVAIPGTFTSTHGRYVVVDAPWVPDGSWMDGSPSVAWVGVLEDVNEAVAGIEADDHFALMDALRDHLHEDTYLVYNPSDSAYSSYDGSYITWNYTWVEMSNWLDRRSGIDLYCHSLACVLSSQANHVGLPAEYVTLAYNFKTNLTRAAGSDTWQQWSFNSHGVVTVDGEHIWDAAVDYDGDDDPTHEPVTAVSAKGVPFEEYLDLLTADDIGQVNGGRCFVF